jgi:hypothetical protein
LFGCSFGYLTETADECSIAAGQQTPPVASGYKDGEPMALWTERGVHAASMHAGFARGRCFPKPRDYGR